MKTIYPLFVIIFFTAISSIAQTEIVYSPDSSINEFSGLALWKNKGNEYIILVPQRPTDSKMYAFTVASVKDALKDSANRKTKNPVVAQEIMMTGMPSFGDGFEAAAIAGNDIYLMIETDTTDNFCYVAKGILALDDNRITIHFTGDKIGIPKPKNADNMGYESLAYIKEKDSLLADFEFNKYTDKPTAYLVSRTLTAFTPVKYDSSLFFRVTDINETDSNTILAINHYYNDARLLEQGKAYKCEYRNYEIENNKVARKQMHDRDPSATNFTRVIELRLNNDRISWQEKKVVSYDSDNWEGILPFANGVLMIVDGNKFTKCKLIYLPLH